MFAAYFRPLSLIRERKGVLYLRKLKISVYCNFSQFQKPGKRRMASRGEVENVASSFQGNLNINFEGDPIGLLQKLKLLQCPFTWNMPNNSLDVKDALDSAEIKIKCFSSFSSPLICCYEYANNDNFVEALGVLEGWNIDKQLDDYLKSKTNCDTLEDVDKAKSSDKVNRESYCHVFYSCVCFILYKLKRFEECEEALKKIVHFENLCCEGQTLVFFLQADMIKEYGYAGIQQALKIVEDALKLSPKSLVLQKFLGRLLGRMRRVEDRNALPGFREINALEYVLSESYDHSAAVHLALVYREYGKNLKQSCKNHETDILEVINDMNCKAADLYSKVFDDHEKTYNILTRVAEGFIRLPPPWRDLEKAWVCLKRALDICEDDPYLNHIAGTFFTLKGDLEKAEFFLNLASQGMTQNYGACVDLMSIRQKNGKYNPIADMESLLQHMNKEPHIESILCNLGAFLYLEMRDFAKAFEYWLQVIQQNICSKKLMDFYCKFSKPPRNISINRIIVHELQRKSGENMCSNNEKAILDKLLTLYPNLKVPHLEKRRFGDGSRPHSSQSQSWNSTTGKEEGSWRRKEPLPSTERAEGINVSVREDSHFTSSSNTSNWRRPTSKYLAQVEGTSYHRPGSRFGQDNKRGNWRRATGGLDSTSLEGQELKGTFCRHDTNSSKSNETENWRSRPAKFAEGTGK